MNSVHYLLFIPFHIGSAEIEKAAKVRKFKDFHESVRRRPIIVSTCVETSELLSFLSHQFVETCPVPHRFAGTYQ